MKFSRYEKALRMWWTASSRRPPACKAEQRNRCCPTQQVIATATWPPHTKGIKHLASAFFTKWLYFASALASADHPAAAPILDKQVHDWLQLYADITLDISRAPDYNRYFDTLTTWGEPYGRTPVQVEKAIFGLKTGRT